MARWLKRGLDEVKRREIDHRIRETVERAISDIDARGDAAVREMSVRFDRWDRDNYRLSPQEIDDCLNQLAPGDTVYLSRLSAAIQDVPGVVAVTVTVPAADVTTAVDALSVELAQMGTVTLAV